MRSRVCGTFCALRVSCRENGRKRELVYKYIYYVTFFVPLLIVRFFFVYQDGIHCEERGREEVELTVNPDSIAEGIDLLLASL